MSEARALIERLCGQAGIAARWHDIWGKAHEVPEASLEALLGQLGQLGDGRGAQASHWNEALPPAAALRAHSSPWHQRVRVPEGARLRWRIEAEDGTRHEAEADCGRLDALETAEIEGRRYAAYDVPIALELAPGYHRFTLEGIAGETLLIAAPERCWRPAALEDDARLWGPSLQLYSLRSRRNWGMGDFTDLLHLIEQWAARGAAVIGLNPLHALFPHNPAHASPYSPSSRLALNVLYLDVEAIDELRDCEPAQRLLRAPRFQARLAALRDAPLVDYAGVREAKFELLELLYAQFRARHLERGSTRAQQFRAFQAAHGDALRRHALYDALQERFHRADPEVWGWQVWPEPYRDPAGEAAARFAAEQLARVEFYEYLQWQAERQLARAAERCAALGLALGLYLDLAVSVDRAGSDAWAAQDVYALGASVGAPPDDFNLKGQDWGLPPLRPDRLRATLYGLYIAALRQAMAHAGALRIDHVMGLMRLFWIPHDAPAASGAYVHYALDEMLAILALESHRNKCLVIGEDLGTVADEMRAALARAGVLSCRLLWFERDAAGEFKPPEQFPREALVAVSTHDLPTLAGWWEGDDLALRERLGLYPDEAVHAAQVAERAADRARLLRALERRRLAPPEPPRGLVDAVHAYVAATPSRVMMLQLEDALGVREQANLPGTTDQHPNWRRKLPLALEDMAAEPGIGTLAGTLARLRPRPAQASAAVVGASARVPRATYRLQLNRDFTFLDAVGLVPYLAKLGVSHVYCSPVLRARPGSAHGYDVVDHNQINPELGGREGFERFVAALRAQDMGLLLDVVPNHMGVMGADNAWWMDVLENGEASAYAGWFDIDWHPVNAELEGKVLVPVLGEHYGITLERGELALAWEPDAGTFAVRYHQHRFPVAPREYPSILALAERALAARPATRAAVDELAGLRAAFGGGPAEEVPALKQRLLRLARTQPDVARAIDAALSELNAPPGDALHRLLEAQHYRLAYWRVASDEINYRRFFDINDLAALRMENEAVFQATHALVLALAADGEVDGLRIDHPDGLYDPKQYFARLQQAYARAAGIALPASEAPEARPARPLYVVAEKITARHEHVPESWALHGTTGYRFGAVVNGLFVDPSAGGRLERTWRAFSGESFDFGEACYRGKQAIMRGALASELTVLATELLRIARADRRTRDYTFNTLRRALAEVAACMPVYRTYIAGKPSSQDRRYVDWAVARATRRSRAADTSIFGFVRQALLGHAPAGAPRALHAQALGFAMKFQQFTSPVAAKGVEDSAHYLYNRLVSLNEVGSDPDMFGFAPSAFHGASADRAARWPHTMLGTSTHDNKRSEDVRLRIDVISEMPAAWRLLLRRWKSLNRMRRRTREGRPAPSRNDEYLLYQTLLGTFPPGEPDEAALEDYRARIEAYMLKAAREARDRTSWISPDEEYEAALANFVRALLGRAQHNPFLEDLRAQAATLAWFGALNSLSMALIKYSSPGVPDLYQGNELIDYSLVDPDNRRPVDYVLRRRLLEEVRDIAQRPGFAPAARALAERPLDGRAKLLVTWRLLELRRERPALFADGAYEPLEAAGAQAAHALAYARRHESGTLVVISGRLFAKLMGEPGKLPLDAAVWHDTYVAAAGLAEGARLQNLLSGETVTVRDGRIALAHAFASFPGAALFAAGTPA
ncbi:MAG TPA: malto-oligosyltrehalose synthase [Burkholderiales bacterium]|nr:malto-oligosyltrehalose synthase [Burkholderiales bacterium]